MLLVVLVVGRGRGGQGGRGGGFLHGEARERARSMGELEVWWGVGGGGWKGRRETRLVWFAELRVGVQKKEGRWDELEERLCSLPRTLASAPDSPRRRSVSIFCFSLLRERARLFVGC